MSNLGVWILIGTASFLALACVAGGSVGSVATSASVMVSLSATPSYGAPPLVVSFEATVGAGIPTSYNWSFGDGAYYNGTNTSAASPTHVYSLPGTYAASVTVFEGVNSGQASIVIHVVAQPLTDRITASTQSGTAPLTVEFTSTVTGGTGTYVNFSWVFGDGGAGSGSSVRYTFVRPGTFEVTLTVHDSGNESASAAVWVNVTAAPSTGAAPWALFLELAPWIGGGLVVGALGFWFIRRSQGVAGRQEVGPSPLVIPAERGEVLPPATSPSGSIPGVGPPSELRVSAETGPSAVRGETLLVSQRVILHLVKQGRLGVDEVAPPTLTQGGIAAALQIPQNSLTNVLRRLVAADAITVDVRHVRGKDRRLKVYRLTSRGEEVARELRSREEHRRPAS